MNKCLIVTFGFFGDIFFQSSIARKLKEENQFDIVDFVIGFPQINRLIKNNPFIDNVFISDPPSHHPIFDKSIIKNYEKVIYMKPFSFTVPPPMECQIWAGVQNPDTEFKIYTQSEFDEVAKKYLDDLRSETNKKVIAIPVDWKERTFLFTKEEYDRGIDSENKCGYGGKRRNVEMIKQELSNYYNIIDLGLPLDVKQNQTIDVDESHTKSIIFECSLMKYCDAFIGSEGGMCNMASGVGCKTIITGDFVHQLYGYNGSVRKIKEPKLGPVHYFKNEEHVELNPYLTDDEVIKEILKNI